MNQKYLADFKLVDISNVMAILADWFGLEIME
jgi:hypothetical protein